MTQLPTIGFSEDADLDSVAAVLQAMQGYAFEFDYQVGLGNERRVLLVDGITTVDDPEGTLRVVGREVDGDDFYSIPLINIHRITYQ